MANNKANKKTEPKPENDKEKNSSSSTSEVDTPTTKENKEKVSDKSEKTEAKPVNEDKEKNSTNGENKPTKNNIIKPMIYLIILAGLIGGSVYMYQKNQVVDSSSIVKVQDYSSLLNSWNEQVQNNTNKKKFLLSRDGNEKVIEQLNKWIKNFYIFGATDSAEYNQFLESNKLEKLLEFNSRMNEDEVREKLKILSEEKTISSIVKKVLMMNDMELWEKLKK